MNMKEAFNYMFKDNCILKKATIYFAFSLFGTFFINLGDSDCMGFSKLVSLLFVLIGSAFMFIPTGYFLNSVKVLRGRHDRYVLPVFNYRNNLITGFKYMAAIFIMCMVVGLICTIATGIFGIISGLFNSMLFLAITLSFIVIIPVIFVFYYIMALTGVFINTSSWLSFMRFKAANIIRHRAARYNSAFWMFALVNLLFGSVISFIKFFLGKSIVGLAVVSFISTLIGAYIVFVNAFIYAKAIEEK